LLNPFVAKAVSDQQGGNDMSIDDLYKLSRKCTALITDSRKVEPGSMFFALKGESFDGNDFALVALEKGARYAVVDRPSLQGTSVGKGECILVQNVLKAFQQIAAIHRQQFDIPVIGITGTNGKTTTKELISAVLAQKYNVISTAGNFNNHIGVPMTLMRLTPKTQIAVVEMGASAPGEIADLTALVQPTAGIVTNVGTAHILGFGSFDGVKKTKGELYDFLRQKGGPVFYNSENPHLREMLSYRKGIVARPYSVQTEFEIEQANAENPFLTLRSKRTGEELLTHLVGAYNADNVMAAICIGRYYNVDEAQIWSAISQYIPSNDRSQMLQTQLNMLIVDTYNANPTSMEAALDNFAKIDFENKTLILGDMGELGAESAKSHDHILEKALEATEDMYLVGPEFTAAAARVGKALPSTVRCFDNIDTLTWTIKNCPVNGRTILIKGSHSNHLESLPKIL